MKREAEQDLYTFICCFSYSLIPSHWRNDVDDYDDDYYDNAWVLGLMIIRPSHKKTKNRRKELEAVWQPLI